MENPAVVTIPLTFHMSMQDQECILRICIDVDSLFFWCNSANWALVLEGIWGYQILSQLQTLQVLYIFDKGTAIGV
jgi:hypothetical protein